jgi:truncated hemoglobin YjbI
MIAPMNATPTPPSLYDTIGGESKLREMVDRFYD